MITIFVMPPIGDELLPGNDTSPAVMLSPNATYFVIVSSGMRDTVTGNVQELVRLCLSVAVHVIVVEPSANVDPDAGVHATVTGASPPDASGVV